MADDTSSPRVADPLASLVGGEEMGRRIRDFDWSSTALGPVEGWPQSLRSALSICLNSNFPIAIYWGSELVLLYNDEWSPIPGKKHPWVLGRPAREAWPEIWHIIEPLFRRVMATGEATRSRDQLLPMHRYGFTEECYFDYTFSPIRGDGGEVEGVFNAVLETTTRVIGERRLRTLRELGASQTGERRTAELACRDAARIIGENPQDLPFALIYLLDEQGQATLVASTGLSTDSPASPTVVSLDATDAPWPFRRAAEVGQSVEVDDLLEKFGPLSGGAWPEPIQQAVILPLAKSGQTQPAGFLVAGVSPRLALNEDYRGFLDLLASHITAAIASARAYEEERRRAEALAELDRAKTTFFSNVSHEFRTPLTLMLGPLEDLLSKSAEQRPPGERELLAVVHRNGQRLQRLVNSLLDFSRIEAGRVQANFEATDLSHFTTDLASNFRSACERAGLMLRVDCPPLSEPVFIDRQMYEKVVLNLLSNAFKFTFDGEIGVTLRQTKGAAELKVWDTGTGIPVDEMPRLFERFHRVENARGRTHEGSGIGLALVNELVKQHGGSIAAESEVGKGTTFTVSIPLGSHHLPAELISTRQTAAVTTTGVNAFVEESLRWLPDAAKLEELASDRPAPSTNNSDERPRVLVADDNADMRQYVVRLLSAAYAVEAVADGEAALAAVRRQLPDLILTDAMMPRLDGFGLLRELRSDARTASLPVILLSARAGEESRVEGMESGADDYLVKPFSAKELLARVASLVQIARVRRESERAIRASETRLRNIFEQTAAGIAQVDQTGRFVLVNQRFCEMTGYTATELSHQTCQSLTHPDDRALDSSKFSAALLDRQPYAIEKRYIRKDGSIIWVRNTVSEFTDESGEPRHLLAVSIDISDSKRAEEALQLSDRRKDEFLATLAHELRNPLAPIRNGLQILRLGLGDPQAVEQTRTMMERQLTQMVHLVDDLLDLSRISRGKIELRKERVELEKVIQQGVETSRPLIEHGDHDLTITLPPSPVYVDADVTRLAQVFSNLLNNAAKYTERSGRVELTVQRRGEEVVVSVKDNGVGIPAHMLPKVFEMFTQVDRNLERSQGGLGIGLCIVKRLVEMHGGSVVAESNGPGTGSEFIVRLPIVTAAVSRNGSGDEVVRPSNRRRILVVDDNQDAAISLAMMLKLMGNETKTAHDGLEALDAAPAYRPDLILLDIGMPRLNGYDTARRIREQSWGKDVVLVALTGWGQEEDRRKSNEAGFDLHMVKPIEPAALQKLLSNLQAGTA